MAVPMVVAVEMGLGHLRPASAVARALGQPLLHADRPPLADADEQRLWHRTRRVYERMTRLSQLRGPLGALLRPVVGAITHIPHLHPARDLSGPTQSVRVLERLIAGGLGRGVADALKRDRVPLFTSFFATALAADHHGCQDVSCLVTDSDLARAWVARDGGKSRIRYFAPTDRVVRRLVAYGVPASRIEMTGFPLPDELLGGPELPVLRRNLARRIARLDPNGTFRAGNRDELAHRLQATVVGDGAGAGEAPLLVFAVGGAGAQANLPPRFLPSLRPLIEAGTLRVALLAGMRPAVAESFQATLARLGLAGHPGARVVVETEFDAYFTACNALLADADILWTKPSEMTFFGALGLPLVLSAPVGGQEASNRRWAIEQGAGLGQRDPRYAGAWITEWLESGTLAGAAWCGFTRLPKLGLYRILQAYGAGAAAGSEARSHEAPSAGSSATRSFGS